jgi:hypothetical protein
LTVDKELVLAVIGSHLRSVSVCGDKEPPGSIRFETNRQSFVGQTASEDENPCCLRSQSQESVGVYLDWLWPFICVMEGSASETSNITHLVHGPLVVEETAYDLVFHRSL